MSNKSAATHRQDSDTDSDKTDKVASEKDDSATMIYQYLQDNDTGSSGETTTPVVVIRK